MPKSPVDPLKSLKYLAKPFYFTGDNTKRGYLLVHGFTASPSEMLPLGQYLHKYGCTVRGVRLAGHGTHYQDLDKTTWHDWFQSVDDEFKELQTTYKEIIPIGLSLGALLCLHLVHKYTSYNWKKLVLLAPPFGIKSQLAKFAPLFKYFVKYQYKGKDSEQYFLEHNLYSYMYRSTQAVTEVNKLVSHVRTHHSSFTVPTLIIYGAKDTMISIPAIKNLAVGDTDRLVIHELQNSGHILTVEPEAMEAFNKILNFTTSET